MLSHRTGEQEMSDTVDGLRVLGPRVLVEIEPLPEKSSGGIFMLEDDRRRKQDSITSGHFKARGETAFENMCSKKNIPASGSFVHFVKYAGKEIEHKGKVYRVMNDEDICSCVDEEKDNE